MLASLSVALLPGLLVVAMGLLLRWLVTRWYDPLPFRVLGVFVLLIALLLGPSLFGGEVLLPLHLLTHAPPYEHLVLDEPHSNQLQWDLILEVAPHEVFTRRVLISGEWPLWNPDVGAGMPVLADAQAHSHWLQPLAAATLAIPLPQAFSVLAALRILTALVFTVLLLRRLGCHWGPAVFGAVAYGFGRFIVLWLGWPIANSAALLPFLLYAVVLTAERGARRDWLLLVVAAYSALVAGHPETILYLLVLAVVVALRYLARGKRDRRGSLLVRWAAAAAIAAGCAAPAVLPAVEHVPETQRYELLERRNARLAEADSLAGWRTTPARREALRDAARRLGPAVAPNSLGNDFFGAYWGEGNIYVFGTGFAGTLTLALALASLASRGPAMPLERGIAWVGLPLVLVVLARPPGLVHLLAAIPGLDRAPSHHSRITLLLGFFLALLAAFSLERWHRRAHRGAAQASGGLVAVGVVAAAYLGFGPEDPEVLARLRWTSLAVQAAAVGLGLATLWWAHRQDRRRPLAFGVLVLIAFGEAAFFGAAANPSTPRALFYPETEAIDFLQERAEGARVVGLGDVLRPNVPSVHGLSDPRISNASKPWDYAFLVSLVSRSYREMTDVFEVASHPLYGLLGVRYVLIRDRFPLDPYLRRAFQGDGLLVYEHPDPLPLLFLPEAADIQASGWMRWMRDNQDFGRRSLVERASAGEVRWESRLPRASTLAIASVSPTRIAARAHLMEPRLLASSVYQDGGWRMLLDGRPVPGVRTNGVFVGAWLPPGDHRLDLVYRPASFVLGCLLAGLGLAAGITWLAPPPVPQPARPDGGTGGS